MYALGLVAIAELDGLVDAGGGAGRGHGAEHALVGVDVRLDGGVTAGVENLASDNLGDGRRGLLLEVLSLRGVKGGEAGRVRDAIFLRHAAERTKREAIRARKRDRTARRALATPETRRASVPRTLRHAWYYPAATERRSSPGILGPCPSSGHLSIRDPLIAASEAVVAFPATHHEGDGLGSLGLDGGVDDVLDLLAEAVLLNVLLNGHVVFRGGSDWCDAPGSTGNAVAAGSGRKVACGAGEHPQEVIAGSQRLDLLNPACVDDKKARANFAHPSQAIQSSKLELVCFAD